VVLAGAALTVLIVAIAALLFVNRSGSQPNSLSVALVPFSADSSDSDARKLAAATHDAVAHTLSQGPFAVSTIEKAPADGRSTGDFVISGQLSNTPDKVITSVRMEETAHHVVVFSHQFETSRDKAWDVPEEIGAQIAAQLSWTAPMIEIERRHPSDPEITAALLQTSATGLQGGSPLHDYENARRLADKAPDSPLALNDFAFSTAFVIGELPRDQRGEAAAAALRAADRTIALAPEFGDAYVSPCMLQTEQRRVECEDHIRKGVRADPDSPFGNYFLAYLILNPVGRNKEASELAGLSLAHDQYMPYKIALMLRLLEATGRGADATDLYRQSMHWWPHNGAIVWFRQTGMLQRGDFEAAQRFGDELGGKSKPSPILLAINRKSLPALRGACPGARDLEATMCMLGFARLGDLDDAFVVADRLYPSRRGRSPADEQRIWLDNPEASSVAFLTSPAAAPLRDDPRYLALSERTGLLAYWRSGRLPDFCLPPRPEPICARLRKP
jgi:TolB-like protein